MKHLVCGLTFAAFALAQHPKVSDCFKVHELLRADEEHYWATWTNTCPYTIDAVYVTVRFADRAAKDLADGIWSLHFIPPGTHRTMRFSAPGRIADFASVHQKKITSDMGEAFGRDMTPPKPALIPVEMSAVSAYRGAVATVSSVVGDSGEGAYRNQPVNAVAAVLKEVLQGTGSQAILVVKPAIIGDSGEALFRTDFPDAWQSLLSPQESAVSVAPRGAFVRFVSEEKPIFQ
jgi:hypothetical protein